MTDKLNQPSLVKASGAGVAERWKAQYFSERDGWSGRYDNPDAGKEIYEKLLALGPDPTPEAVAQAIGNKGWSYIWCKCCGEYVTECILFAETDDTIHICYDCVKAAEHLIGMKDASNQQGEA